MKDSYLLLLSNQIISDQSFDLPRNTKGVCMEVGAFLQVRGWAHLYASAWNFGLILQTKMKPFVPKMCVG